MSNIDPGEGTSAAFDPVDNGINDEPHRSHRGRKIAIVAGSVAAAGALAAGAWFGLKGSGTPAPSNTPSASAPATPGSTPTPEATTPPVAEAPANYPFNVDQATVNKYLDPNFSLDAFAALPVEQRALVALYYAQNMPKFAADWHSISKNSLDKLPAAITIDMSPQDIVTFNVYLHRMANTIPDPTDPNGYKMDEDAADKMLAGSFVNPLNSPNYPGFISKADQFAHDGSAVNNARTLAVSGIYFPMSTADPTSSTEVLHDANGTYRSIRIVEADGSSNTLIYRWIVADNGVGVWLQQG